LEQRIELHPNCSLTPATALVFYSSICALSLLVALFFVLQGFWPILPFWGLEMAVLGWALLASLKRRHYFQILLITDSLFTVLTHSPLGEQKREFSRHWAKVKLRRPRTNLYPSRLVIESHGRALEVGSFLNEDDRRDLAKRLRALVGERQHVDTND
jgi:uncharacterized membrane protein